MILATLLTTLGLALLSQEPDGPAKKRLPELEGRELPEPSWAMTAAFEQLLGDLQGGWELKSVFMPTVDDRGRQAVGNLLVAKDFMALEVHMGFFDPRAGLKASLFQTGTYRLAMTDDGLLILTTLIGSNFDEQERLVFEVPGWRRGFVASVDGNVLQLEDPLALTRFVFERMPSARRRDFYGNPLEPEEPGDEAPAPVPDEPPGPLPEQPPPEPDPDERPWYEPEEVHEGDWLEREEFELLLDELQGGWQLMELHAPNSDATGRQEVGMMLVASDLLTIEVHLGYFDPRGRLVESYFQSGAYRLSLPDNGLLTLTTLIGSGFDQRERLIYEPPGWRREFVATLRGDTLTFQRLTDGSRYEFERLSSLLRKDLYGNPIPEEEEAEGEGSDEVEPPKPEEPREGDEPGGGGR